jgi:hypothetical protein
MAYEEGGSAAERVFLFHAISNDFLVECIDMHSAEALYVYRIQRDPRAVMRTRVWQEIWEEEAAAGNRRFED